MTADALGITVMGMPVAMAICAAMPTWRLLMLMGGGGKMIAMCFWWWWWCPDGGLRNQVSVRLVCILV